MAPALSQGRVTFDRTSRCRHVLVGAEGGLARQALPTLEGLLERVYIAGVLQNTPDNLVAWILDPPRFAPHTAMAPTGIRDQEARDVAAYLYAH